MQRQLKATVIRNIDDRNGSGKTSRGRFRSGSPVSLRASGSFFNLSLNMDFEDMSRPYHEGNGKTS